MGSQFAAVPLSIFNDERLNALDVVVYAALDSFVNSAGEAWPSLRAVAERGKVSPATVKRSIQRLQSAGYIFREQRRTTEKKEFDSTLYKLSFRGKVGSVRAKVGSVRVGGLALTELGVGSDRASNHTHITIPNEPLPPTPQNGGPHPPPREF
jgi:DNA-binding transcriptional MocR family regulator